jgi:hypothetical protein
VKVTVVGLGSPTEVLLGSGRNFPDALSASAAAVHTSAAVLLSGRGLPHSVEEYLANEGATVTAVGGPAAQVAPIGATTLVGKTRYQTARKVAEAFFETPTTVSFATGRSYADGLSGGPHAGRSGPLLLVGKTPAPSVLSYLERVVDGVETVYVYGGESAVPRSVEQEVANIFAPSVE